MIVSYRYLLIWSSGHPYEAGRASEVDSKLQVKLSLVEIKQLAPGCFAS